MAGIKIHQCGCSGSFETRKGAQFQDERYGKGNRVYNRVGKEGKSVVFRCSICGAEKDLEPKKDKDRESAKEAKSA